MFDPHDDHTMNARRASTHQNTCRRILYLDPAGQLWGSERSLLLLLSRLDRSRYMPYLCFPPRSVLAARARNLSVHCLPYFQARLHEKGLAAKAIAAAGFLYSLARSRPALMHLNQAGAIAYAMLAHRITKIPLVVHVRLAEDAPLLAKRASGFKAIRFVAISSFVRDALLAAGLSGDTIVQITNPIDLVSFHPEVNPVSPSLDELLPHRAETRKIGFVGRLSPDKGIETFLQAMKMIVARHPDVIGVVVGDSNGVPRVQGRDYLDVVKDLARDLGIANRVEFLGYQKHANQLMHGFDVFALPSYAEPWGRVVCEAMVADTPVVASDCAGPRDIIDDGINGLLVPPKNPEMLATAITRILDSPDLRASLIKAGHQWVRDNCSPEKHAVSIMQLYDSVL